MNAYAAIGSEVRASLRGGHRHDPVSRAAHRVKTSCELLDLARVGIVSNLKEGKYGEAEFRATAAERFAEDLLKATQQMAISVRNAGLARRSAA